jgi:hypothetical protein
MRRLFLLFIAATTALGQQKPPADLAVTPLERAKLVEAAAVRIEGSYVDAAKAKEIAAALRTAAKSGQFDSATSALQLVPLVNRVLKPSGDLHLRFGYSAEAQSMDDDAPETPEQRAADELEAARAGYGLHTVSRLEGNIGLIEWTAFFDPQSAGDLAQHALQLLKSTDALILDLRHCTGGSPYAINFVLTYFLAEGDPVLVSTTYFRPDDVRRQYWTASWVPGPRYLGKKLYVLTSKRTFSGGEGLTEHLRRLAHATVVGETTRGGAHLTRWYHIHPHFAVAVPIGRHVAPPEFPDWEGVGITPDVAVPETDALSTAHALALRSLRDAAHDADSRAFYEEALTSVEKKP